MQTADASTKCRWCGRNHVFLGLDAGEKCPSVKAFEYHPDGSVKRVEFFAPNDYAPISGATGALPACRYQPSSPRVGAWGGETN